MPRVSVVIPVYNTEQYISNAIESVLSQSFQDFEIIVINDGSTDNSEKEILKFQDKVIYLKQDNKGRSTARNAGLEIARGEYIAFLDADDEWTREKLARQVKYLDNHPETGVVYSEALCMDEKGQCLRFNQFRKHIAYSGDITEELLKSIFILTPTVMMRRSCLKNTGYFDSTIKRAQDLDYWLRLSIFNKIDFLPGTLVRFRALNWLDSEARIESYKGRLKAFTKLKKNFPDKVNKTGRIFDLVLSRHYQEFAREYIYKKNFVQANYYYNKALGLTPEFNNLLTVGAITSYLAGQLHRAIRLMSDMLKTDPYQPKVHFYLGCCYFKRNQWGKAQKSFLGAIESLPHHNHFPEVLNNLALTYVAQGNINEAGAWLWNALNQKPDYRDARQNYQHLNENNLDIKQYLFTPKTFAPIV